jgi:hypothetical protein
VREPISVCRYWHLADNGEWISHVAYEGILKRRTKDLQAALRFQQLAFEAAGLRLTVEEALPPFIHTPVRSGRVQ